MECKNCKRMRKFQRECWCDHEKVREMPDEMFGRRAKGFICYTDGTGYPRTKTHPRWCPLPQGNVKKGQYTAEWDEEKRKIALKFVEGQGG